MRTFIGLAAAVVSGFLSSCGRANVRPSEGTTDVGACATHRCQGLQTNQPDLLDGRTTFNILSFASPCRFEASWKRADVAEDSFHATFDARDGDVFALHGYVVQLVYCHGLLLQKEGYHHNFPPSGEVLFNPPDLAWAAPDADNVFIPLGGDATLEGTYVARATIENPNGATVEVSPRSAADATDGAPSVYRHLHTGDTFPWGTHRAAIVRVVAPDAPLVGWVEVRLF